MKSEKNRFIRYIPLSSHYLGKNSFYPGISNANDHVLFPCSEEALIELKHLLVDVHAQFRARSTVRLVVARAQELALRVSDVLGWHGASVAVEVESVATPTFTAILDTGVVVLPALLSAQLRGHEVAVVEDLLRQQTSLAWLSDTRVVGEVAVTLPDSGAGGAGLRRGRSGTGGLDRCRQSC